MPIRQPKQRTIYTSEFLDKAYCFTIESTLEPQEQRSGLLMLSASAGYLLTTSFSNEPKREQAFRYTQQPDGSWLATDQVKLTATEDSPGNGTIVIRSPLAETIVITIEATSGAVVLLEHPKLTVSESVLTFPQTSPGKPSFRILTVAQQPNVVSAPVTLTTDAPEQFQLACDSRPTFSPTLTLTPSSLGTYVHVRYSAGKSGFDRGQLTIRSEYEERTIALEGRSVGLLPGIRALSPASNLATLRRPNRPFVPRQLPLVLALALSIGLVYAGYSNRCQLFPALCNDKVINQTTSQDRISVSTLSNADDNSEKVALTTATIKRSQDQEVILSNNKPASATTRPFLRSSARQPKQDRVNNDPADDNTEAYSSRPTPQTREKSINQNTANQIENRTSRRIPPAPLSEESELEQVLNKKQ